MIFWGLIIVPQYYSSCAAEFSISLGEDISDRTEGPTGALLNVLQQGVRDQGANVNMDEVRADAQDIHQV